MNARSDYFVYLSPHDTVSTTIMWIIELVHHENWNSSVKKFLFGYDNFSTPEVNHEEGREFLELLFKNLMKKNSVILECEVFHFAKLEENDSIHIFRFRLPINFKHRAHIFVFRLINLQFIVNAIPSLDKWRPVVLSNLVIIMLKLNDFFADTVGILTLIQLFSRSLPLCFFLRGLWALLNGSFLLDIILIQGVLSGFIFFIFWEINFHLFGLKSFPHWSQKL